MQLQKEELSMETTPSSEKNKSKEKGEKKQVKKRRENSVQVSNKVSLKLTPGMSLADFVAPKLQGSSLTLRQVSESELYIDCDEILQIHVEIETKDAKRIIFEDLFSPKWQRKVTVEHIKGNEFLELQAEEELQKENFEEIAGDVLLALDLVNFWAKSNKMQVSSSK